MGAAIDSFIMGTGIAGFVAIVGLVFSILGRLNKRFPNIELTKRKPFLLAALLFATTWIVLLNSEMLPISGYRGENSIQHIFVGNKTYGFNVYSGQQYMNTILFEVESNLERNEVLIVCIEFYERDVKNLVHSKNFNITPHDIHELASGEETFEIHPGQYTINITTSFYETGIGYLEPKWVDIQLSQRLGPNHLEELLLWNTLFFFLLLINFVFITAGLYIDLDKAKKPDEIKSKESDYDKTLEESYDEYLDLIR